MKIEDKGFLTDFSRHVLKGESVNKQNKLTTAQLTRVARHLGKIQGDVYEALFEKENHLIGDFNSKDLAAFVFMDHSKARGYYWKPDTSVTTADTVVCHGVPLAFYGQRLMQGKTYMSWLDGLDLSDLTQHVRVDIFMPHGLHSLDLESGEIEVANLAGLTRCIYSDIEFTHEDVRELRSEVHNYLNTARPKKTINPIYNALNYLVRCLVLQGWCWSTACRHENMIMDLKDWDKMPKSIDRSYEGLKPDIIGFDKWIK